MEDLQFQKLDLDGVKTLVKWAGLEGWNPGPCDAEVFNQTDPDGFYGYFRDGELIAGGSIVSYENEFGFMGFFIVLPEYRSLGIGRMLWHQRRDTLVARLNKGASIGMDGVVSMQSFYEKGGFQKAFRGIRYERIGTGFDLHENIAGILEEDIPQVLDYDKRCFGFLRSKFMIPWLTLSGNKTFKYMEDNMLKGFAVMRKVDKGYKICPLFADHSLIAEELYKACLNAAVDEPVYLDIPEVNKEAQIIIEKYNAEYVFECARMYLGPVPQMEIDKIYGITTFELG